MRRTLSALAILAAFSSAATAGILPVQKRNAIQDRPAKYLLSANLNKLVFWHVPSRDEGRADR